LGTKAVQALIAGESDQMVGLGENKMVLVPLAEVVSRKREIDSEFLDLFKMVA